MGDFTLGTMYWLNPNLSAEAVARDVAAMRDNGFSLIRCIAWWELVEPTEGEFDFTIVDKLFAAAEEQGVGVMATLGFYPPFWLTRRLDALGKNDPGRYPCLARPEVAEPLREFIRAFVRRYRESHALAYWNVWNEPTVNNTRNEVMLTRFVEWLRRRYSDDQTLRAAWQGEHPVFSLLCPPNRDALTPAWLAEAFRLGTRGRCTAISFDWHRFLAEELAEQLAWLCAEVRSHDAVHPTHTNFHSLADNPMSDGRDLFRLAAVPDTVSFSVHASHDYAPGAELNDRPANYGFAVDQAYSWTRGGKPVMAGEVQAGTTNIHVRQYTPAPEDIRRELWWSVGAGLVGHIYWQWQAWRAGTFELGDFGLRNPSDGGETDRSREVKRFAELYGRHREAFARVRRQPSDVALLYSQDTHIYRLITGLDHAGVDRTAQAAQDALFGCYRALTAANFAVEFVSEAEAAAGELARYRVCYMPGVEVVRREAAEGLRRFVEGGGWLWADGRLGFLDEHMYLRDAVPGHGLARVFGAREEDYVALGRDAEIRAGEKRVARGLAMAGRLTVVAGGVATGVHADGSVAVVDHAFGAGRTRWVGAQCCRRLREYDDPETRGYVAEFARAAGVEPVGVFPDGLCARRLSGEGREVLILYNRTDAPIAADLTFPNGNAQSLYGGGIVRGQPPSIHPIAARQTEVFIIEISPKPGISLAAP